MINEFILKAKENLNTIVLPEYMDERILKAAEIVLKENIAKLIIIGDGSKLTKYNLTGAKIINPNKEKKLTEELANSLYQLRKNKGITLDNAKKLLLTDYMYYAVMLVKMGYADGVVSGACHSTANTFIPALQIIKCSKDAKLVSSFFLINVSNSSYGLNGNFLFSDCALNQNPNAEELANIAISSAKSFKYFFNSKPYVALLSHSTKGSAKHEMVDKVVNATKIAHEIDSNIELDGELQVDAALDLNVAKRKLNNSNVAGRANVLIFPNIDAGNIGYKLVRMLAGATCLGPITQGMNAPINDLSRNCTVEDIVGVIAITSMQCNN